MNNMKKWVRGGLTVAAVAGLLFLLIQLITAKPLEPYSRPGAQAGTAAAPVSGPLSGNGSVLGDGALGAQSAPAPVNAWFDQLPGGNVPALESPLSTMSPPQFAADSRGKLVLNADTHANVEKLLLEQDPAVMRATLDKITGALPAQAAAELKVLVGQFQQYSKALSATISPENAPETEQEGLKLLDSLHTLRVSYLGPDTAKALFGQEEATTRQLIALMQAEKDPNLTPQQKAERAQEILNRQAQPGLPPAS